MQDNEIGRQRVRMSIEGGSLCLHSLAGALLARWSLNELKNHSVPVLGRDWVICDQRIAGPILTVENDQDYLVIQRAAPHLASLSRRTLHQLIFAYGTSIRGNLTGESVLLLAIVAVPVLGLWWFWS